MTASSSSVKSVYCYACNEDKPEDFNSFPCGHGMCSPCQRSQVKALPHGATVFDCGMCRAQVSSITVGRTSEVLDVAALLAKADKKRDINANLEASDPRYRWVVESIVGIRCLVPNAPLEIEYKVVWASQGPGRRAERPSWERAPFFDEGTMLASFHARMGLLPATHPSFDWTIGTIEVPAPKKKKTQDGKVMYHCSHSTCAYKSNRKSNIEAHERSQHSAPGVRFPCPCCNSTFGVQGAMVKHFKKYHQANDKKAQQ